jgi:hypothetical protein
MVPGAVERLTELRERRRVIAHKGSIADQRYCKKTGRWDCLDKRLEVSADYLNTAVEFIDNLTAGLAILTRYKLPSQETKRVNWDRIVTTVFASETNKA